MSMRCITDPPRMKPSGLASFGRTTCTISVADSDERLGVRLITTRGTKTTKTILNFLRVLRALCGSRRIVSSEILSNPDGEARFAEARAAAARGEHHVLPILVE